MKITYDLDYLPERRSRGQPCEEVLAIQTFLAGSQKNMCIEYDSDKDAKRRYDTVRNFRRQHKLQEVFEVFRREKCLYIVRTKKKGTPRGKSRTEGLE